MEELTVKIRSYDQNEFIVSYKMFGSITPFVICSCFLMEYSGIIINRMLSNDSSDDNFIGTKPMSILPNTILSRFEEYKLEIARSSLGLITLNSNYSFNRGFHEFRKSANIFKMLDVRILNKKLITPYGFSFECKPFSYIFIGCQNQSVFNENSRFICFAKNKFDEFIVGKLRIFKMNHQIRNGIQKSSIRRGVKIVNYENKRKQIQNEVLNYEDSENLNLKEILLNINELNSRNNIVEKREILEGTKHSTELMLKKNTDILKCNETDSENNIIHLSTENIDEYNADETRNIKNITFIFTTEEPLCNSEVSDKMLKNVSSNYKEDKMVDLPMLRLNRRKHRVQFRNEKGNSSSRKKKGLKINDINSRAFKRIAKVKGNNTRKKNYFQNGEDLRFVNRDKEDSARIENGNVSRATYKLKTNTTKMKNEKALSTYDKVKGNYARIKSGTKLGNNLVQGTLNNSVNLKNDVKKSRKNRIQGNKGRRVYKRKHNRLVFTTESYLKNYEGKTGRKHKYIYNTTTEQISLNRVSESNMKLFENIGEMNRTLSHRVTSDKRKKYSHKGSKNEHLYNVKLEDNVKSKSNKNRTLKHSMDKRKKFGRYNVEKLKSERKQINRNLLKPLVRNSEVRFGDLNSSNLSEIAVNDTLRAKELNKTGENEINQTQLINFLQFITKEHNVISTSERIESTLILSDFNTIPNLGSTITVLLNNMSIVNNDLHERGNESEVNNEIQRTEKEKAENVIQTNIPGRRGNTNVNKASEFGSDDKSTSNRSGEYQYSEKNYWKIIIIPVVATVFGILVLIGMVFLCWRCCCAPILRNAECRRICHCQACSCRYPTAYY